MSKIEKYIASTPKQPLLVWFASNDTIDNLRREIETWPGCTKIMDRPCPMGEFSAPYNYKKEKSEFFLYHTYFDQLCEENISYCRELMSNLHLPVICLVNDYSHFDGFDNSLFEECYVYSKLECKSLSSLHQVMTIQEQIAMAEKYGVAARTPEEVTESIVRNLKSKFDLDKPSQDTLDRWFEQWANERFNELVAEGWDENDEATENAALEYAKTLERQIMRSSSSSRSIMIWTIENNRVEELIAKALEDLNADVDAHLNLYVFDAYDSSKAQYVDFVRTINTGTGNSVALIKNITRASEELYYWVYDDVKNTNGLSFFPILTSPIKLPNGEKELWDRDMDVSHVALLTV